jgi:hypothetical protein
MPTNLVKLLLSKAISIYLMDERSWPNFSSFSTWALCFGFVFLAIMLKHAAGY